MEDWEIKALEDEKLALLDELVVLEGFGPVCLVCAMLEIVLTLTAN